MTQIATNKEQSARLIACGVDEATADMGRIIGGTDNPNGWQEICNIREAEWWSRTPIEQDGQTIEHIVPTEYAWSLSALLALLPSEIKEDNSYFEEVINYGLLIYPYMQGWQIDYQYCEYDECHCLKCMHDSELIEACVQMIEWLTANNYKLNNNG